MARRRIGASSVRLPKHDDKTKRKKATGGALLAEVAMDFLHEQQKNKLSVLGLPPEKLAGMMHTLNPEV